MALSSRCNLLESSLSSLRNRSFIYYSRSYYFRMSNILACLAWKSRFYSGCALMLRKSLISLFFSLKLRSLRLPVAPDDILSSFSMQSITYLISMPVEASLFLVKSSICYYLALFSRSSFVSTSLTLPVPPSFALCFACYSFFAASFAASSLDFYADSCSLRALIFWKVEPPAFFFTKSCSSSFLILSIASL